MILLIDKMRRNSNSARHPNITYSPIHSIYFVEVKRPKEQNDEGSHCCGVIQSCVDIMHQLVGGIKNRLQ